MMKHDDDISSDSDDEGHDHDHEQKVIILISPLHLCRPYGMDNTIIPNFFIITTAITVHFVVLS